MEGGGAATLGNTGLTWTDVVLGEAGGKPIQTSKL